MKSLAHLAARWPSTIVARRKIGDFTGGAISPKTLANLDSAGEGPPRLKIGRQTCYPVETLVAWLEKRTS